MFERYTEGARRVLFFARHEAAQRGTPSIDAEHLLLGLLRESTGIASLVFERSHVSFETIRNEIENQPMAGPKVATLAEVPFSPETKRILYNAATEADRLRHKAIDTEHLLLGILCEETCFA